MAFSKAIEFNALVSVIIPCYNHGKFLDGALDSVLKQTYENWECIIINDGSGDNTEELSLSWEKADSRIRYFSKPNGGLSSARNYGLNKAAGEYIQFLDADDSINPLKLDKSVKVLSESDNKQAIIISDFQMFDEALKKIMPAYCNLSNIDFNFNTILMGWDDSFTIPIHCAVFPAVFFKKISFEETLRAKEDWVMWLSVFKEYNPKVLFINEKLAVYKGNLDSMSNHKRLMYENTSRAFEIIYNKLVEGSDKPAFFRRVNDYWLKETLFHERENTLMNNSKYFRLRKKILQIFNKIQAGK